MQTSSDVVWFFGEMAPPMAIVYVFAHNRHVHEGNLVRNFILIEVSSVSITITIVVVVVVAIFITGRGVLIVVVFIISHFVWQFFIIMFPCLLMCTRFSNAKRRLLPLLKITRELVMAV